MTYAIAFYILSVIADIASTNYFLRVAPTLREANPLMRKLMEKLGSRWWVGKLALNGAIGYVLYTYAEDWTFWLLGAMGWGAAFWNLRLVRKSK